MHSHRDLPSSRPRSTSTRTTRLGALTKSVSFGARGGAEAHELGHESLCERVHHARREFERVNTIFNYAVTFNCAGAAVNGHVAECNSEPQAARMACGGPSAATWQSYFMYFLTKPRPPPRRPSRGEDPCRPTRSPRRASDGSSWGWKTLGFEARAATATATATAWQGAIRPRCHNTATPPTAAKSQMSSSPAHWVSAPTICSPWRARRGRHRHDAARRGVPAALRNCGNERRVDARDHRVRRRFRAT